jgi:hypothetical protein
MKLTLLAIAFALFSVAGVAAAPQASAPAECITLADDLDVAALDDPTAGPGGRLVVYPAARATAFIAATTAIFGPPPRDLTATTAVATYVPADPRFPGQIHFYSGDPGAEPWTACRFYISLIDRDGLANIVKRMLAGSI